ncbi:MAG: hypothetical protein KIT22_20665, partial [Verrucomicrobiae bacterium]|nr:hypothetical protein [Verrucomicrobiae bacterium]
VAVHDSHAFVAVQGDGLWILDVANPASPQLTGRYATLADVQDMAFAGSLGCLALGAEGIELVDFANPAAPEYIGGIATGGFARGVALSNRQAYVADGSAGLVVLDVSDPSEPLWQGAYDTAGFASGVAVAGNYAYVADDSAGLQIIDVSDPANPARVAGLDTEGFAVSVSVAGDVVSVADGAAGLALINVSDPASPERIGGSSGYTIHGVTPFGNLVLAAAGADGLLIFELVASTATLKPLEYSSAGFRFTVSGKPGQSARVQRSDDLAHWSDWQTVTLTDTPTEISDSSVNDSANTFYRAIGL